MLPTDNLELFEAILKDFDDNGILQDFILIGSWVLRVYSEHFNNDPQVPIVATQDLDLLVTNPPKVSREVNIAEILSKYDLEEASNPWDSNSKFVGPDFEVEFLIPEKVTNGRHGGAGSTRTEGHRGALGLRTAWKPSLQGITSNMVVVEDSRFNLEHHSTEGISSFPAPGLKWRTA